MTVGPGIGGMIIAGRERCEMDLVMLGILILGVVGYLIDRKCLVARGMAVALAEGVGRDPFRPSHPI